MILIKKCLLISMFILVSSVVTAQEMKAITWYDLRPQLETVEDPFAKLDPNQLYLLGTISRYREELEKDNFQLSEKTVAEVKKIEADFIEAGIDVDELFAKQQIITEQRTKQATLPNDKVLGKTLRIPGFITPVEMEGTKVTKFFLVPSPGACIHTPPPPPNQIVLVSFPDGIELNGLDTPFWVEGELLNQNVTADVNYSDGASNVESVYQMSAQSVELYKIN
ncbi:DUF3299 domain-containing protein [Vibrio comitans]|uniref:DUF3299 domain-containing protein n=1 Tax=Vibrio comitans NBRC 102076 TaxID=1219078 RepID=A0A4Y3IJ07_9VIBR|nr:DUF3299 domain-containing protein [Vibrio comitans]GEA59337.1 hypothetical protein VCO01S_05300 [Vibrio comitans NBRC 102076]